MRSNLPNELAWREFYGANSEIHCHWSPQDLGRPHSHDTGQRQDRHQRAQLRRLFSDGAAAKYGVAAVAGREIGKRLRLVDQRHWRRRGRAGRRGAPGYLTRASPSRWQSAQFAESGWFAPPGSAHERAKKIRATRSAETFPVLEAIELRTGGTRDVVSLIFNWRRHRGAPNWQANVWAWANLQFALGLWQPKTVGLSILRPVRM